jgi:hypothetical protein
MDRIGLAAAARAHSLTTQFAPAGRTETTLKISTALVLVFGLLIGQCVNARQPVLHPCWVIMATLIDRTTGARIKRSELRDRELEFEDPAECKSIIDRVPPVHMDNIITVLTCRKVERAYTPGEWSQPGHAIPLNEGTRGTQGIAL